MLRQNKTLRDLHGEALAEFDTVQAAVRDERLQCLEDRRFYSIAGAQWEGALGDQFENKPRFEINRTHLAVMRVINEYRNNRITVDFTTKDGRTNDKLADTCDGLYRADEQASVADEAYDNGFEEAVGGGYGAFRLRQRYEDEEDDGNEAQRIGIEPIFDADSSVFFNLDAKRQDKSDARRCWVISSMTRDAFEEQFGHNPDTWPKDINSYQFDWCTPDFVYVAEYYVVEESKEKVFTYEGIDGSTMRVAEHEFEEEPGKRAELRAYGFRKVGEKQRTVRKVHKYLLSGLQVEEDCGYIAGKHIPIIPIYGKRWYVDGVERFQGHVRIAKDAQRLVNMLMSWLAEMAARFDIEKPIVTPAQILGHAQMWAEDNISKFPYLTLNESKDASGEVIPGVAPLQYTRAPNIPPAMAALMQIAEQALSDLLGNQQAGEELQPNLSGKAVELIQTRLDLQAHIYMSNFAKALKRAGEVWLSMMRDIVVEENRRMKTLDPNGEPSSVVVNAPGLDPDSGAVITANDLTRASFDVTVDVGPSSSSRRAATVRALRELQQATVDPETQQILSGLILMNIEGEGLADAREYFRRKLIRMGAVKPNEAEQKELAEEQANQKPDANEQYLQAAAEAEAAKAVKARADTVKVLADADKSRAQTTQIEAETTGNTPEQRIATAQSLRDVLTPPESE